MSITEQELTFLKKLSEELLTESTSRTPSPEYLFELWQRLDLLLRELAARSSRERTTSSPERAAPSAQEQAAV